MKVPKYIVALVELIIMIFGCQPLFYRESPLYIAPGLYPEGDRKGKESWRGKSVQDRFLVQTDTKGQFFPPGPVT